MADKAITRRLKIFVNGNEVDATITNLRKNLAKFRTLANREIEGTDKFKKYNAEVAKLEQEYDQARKAQKDFREDIKLTASDVTDGEKALSDFSGSFSQMLNGFKSGDLLQVKEGFSGVKNGIKGATKAGLAFIATPLGAAIAVLVGVGVAAKAWFDYNSQVVDALRLTQQITGLTDGAADQARIRAEALSDAFDTDFKQTLLSAKSLAQQFGISFEEAFDVIEGQLVRGQANNDEFFTNLDEYSVFFKQAGFSATEFGNIIAAGFDLGIYQDKLPDALKEADLALKEQTKSTRDALVNAFGAPFSDDLLGRISSGVTSTKEALGEIAAEADKTQLSQQQQAQLTADVFKAAGEDAGGAIKVLEALNGAINENQRELTESEQITQDQITANKELKAITSAVFSTGDKGFGLLIDRAKLFATQTLVSVLKAGIDVYNWVVDLNNESDTFSTILTVAGIAATSTFDIIGILISNAKKSFGGLADVIEGVFTLNIDKIKEGMSKGVDATVGVFSDIKSKALADAEEIKNAFAGGSKLERKNLSDFIGVDNVDPLGPSEGETKTINGVKYIFQDGEWQPVKKGGDGNAESTSVESEEDLTAEDKRIVASKKKVAEFLKEFEDGQKLLKEIEGLEAAEAAQIKEELELEAKYAKLEQQAADEKTLLAQLEEAKNVELAAIDKKYKDAEAEKDKKHQAKITADQKKANAQRLADRKKLQNDIISGAIALAGEETKVGKALLLARQILAAKETLVEIGKLKAKTSIAAADASLSIVQGTAKTASAGFPAAIPLLLLFAAQAVGIYSSVRKAKKEANAVQAPSFNTGGYTGRGNLDLGSNEGGYIRGVVEEDEYVVPKPVMSLPGVPRIIEYLEAKRTGKSDSFDAGETPAEVSASSSGSDSSLLMTLIEKLLVRLDIPLKVTFTLNDVIELHELEQKLEDTITESKGN